jgi:threonine dehydratase
MTIMFAFADIINAEMKIRPFLAPTMLEPAPDLASDTFLKLENTQLTHSFKIRGALNAVLSLNDEERQRGIVTASSGNHAQGVAYAAHLTGTQAQVLMPKHTPQKKVRGVQRWGAEAVLWGDNYDETETEALRRARDEGLHYVSAYNDRFVMAGAGTIGIEIVRQMPDVERVLVCVSGGGLIGGVATAIKHLRPQAQVIGVGAQSAPAMYNRFHGTDYAEQWETLAEALSGDIEEGAITVPIVMNHVDNIVLVSEEQIATAMRWLVEVQGWLVEGGGAVGVAAVLHDVVPRNNKKTAIVVSGGNLDASTLMRVLGD